MVDEVSLMPSIEERNISTLNVEIGGKPEEIPASRNSSQVVKSSIQSKETINHDSVFVSSEEEEQECEGQEGWKTPIFNSFGSLQDLEHEENLLQAIFSIGKGYASYSDQPLITLQTKSKKKKLNMLAEVAKPQTVKHDPSNSCVEH